MRRPRLFWRIYAALLVVVALCTIAVGSFAVTSARSSYRDNAARELESRASLVGQAVAPLLAEGTADELEALVERLGAASDTRLTVISGVAGGAPLGTVLAESDLAAVTMENHRDRPEFVAALEGRSGLAVRVSSTLGAEEMYVAVPMEEGGRVRAVVRASRPLTSIDEALTRLYWQIGLSAVVVALLAALIGLLLSRAISRQMRLVEEGAERFAKGDFASRLPVPRIEEFAVVAESVNEMADELDEQIRGLTRERNEREAVLASMVEGVVAVDVDERVITVNEAAAHLLGAGRADAVGSSIQEVVRNPELQRVVAETLLGEGPVEAELVLRVGAEDRILQANGTLLRGESSGSVAGAVVVLNDVTRLKRLEAVRRDFVANVSHELKTPVTSIKGFTETLLDGAGDDPEARERFLRIVAGQADRLNSIISDLLALSTLEADRAGGAPLQEAEVCDVVHVAVEVCGVKAEGKGIRLDVACPESVSASINPPLLEQAVVNLVDNAIKYSPEGSTVLIGLEARPSQVVITVRDQGPGIAREHLPRLFERFYRVDEARSRDLGGTGLGLAIVKHIAQLHGGRVGVDSRVGAGSVFSLYLPRG
jgi:two-component system phosphate regulon sensor histidine kinase PhoR